MYGIPSAVFVVTVLPYFVATQSNIGDTCTLRTSNAKGTCQLFSDCAPARQDLQQNNQFPQTCGFKGTQPIVCCPEGQRVPGDISKKKCQEYEQFVYQSRPSPTLNLGETESRNRSECGHRVVTLIVGGEKAGRKEFPHMASVGYEPSPGDEIQWLCGGTIISHKYILTAAHCLSDYAQGDAKWVRVGVTNLNVNRRNRLNQDIQVVDRIAHPEYKSPIHYHDIGLLKLEKEIRMSPYARPACLYLKHDIKAERAIASGWGHTQWGGDLSVDLRKVTLDLFTHDFCNASYKNQIGRKLSKGIVDEIQVCAGSADPNKDKDTCQGDSGGPLQIYHIGDEIKCMYDIIGITSFGKACSGSPGVYVRVSNYIKWIEDVVWPQ